MFQTFLSASLPVHSASLLPLPTTSRPQFSERASMLWSFMPLHMLFPLPRMLTFTFLSAPQVEPLSALPSSASSFPGLRSSNFLFLSFFGELVIAQLYYYYSVCLVSLSIVKLKDGPNIAIPHHILNKHSKLHRLGEAKVKYVFI